MSFNLDRVEKLSTAVREMLGKPPNVSHLNSSKNFKSQNSALATQNAEMRSRISQLERDLRELQKKYTQEKFGWKLKEIELENNVGSSKALITILCLLLMAAYSSSRYNSRIW